MYYKAKEEWSSIQEAIILESSKNWYVIVWFSLGFSMALTCVLRTFVRAGLFDEIIFYVARKPLANYSGKQYCRMGSYFLSSVNYVYLSLCSKFIYGERYQECHWEHEGNQYDGNTKESLFNFIELFTISQLFVFEGPIFWKVYWNFIEKTSIFLYSRATYFWKIYWNFIDFQDFAGVYNRDGFVCINMQWIFSSTRNLRIW